VEEACEARSLFTTPLPTPCGTPCRGDPRTFSYAKPPLAGRGSTSSSRESTFTVRSLPGIVTVEDRAAF